MNVAFYSYFCMVAGNKVNGIIDTFPSYINDKTNLCCVGEGGQNSVGNLSA